MSTATHYQIQATDIIDDDYAPDVAGIAPRRRAAHRIAAERNATSDRFHHQARWTAELGWHIKIRPYAGVAL